MIWFRSRVNWLEWVGNLWEAIFNSLDWELFEVQSIVKKKTSAIIGESSLRLELSLAIDRFNPFWAVFTSRFRWSNFWGTISMDTLSFVGEAHVSFDWYNLSECVCKTSKSWLKDWFWFQIVARLIAILPSKDWDGFRCRSSWNLPSGLPFKHSPILISLSSSFITSLRDWVRLMNLRDVQISKESPKYVWNSLSTSQTCCWKWLWFDC